MNAASRLSQIAAALEELGLRYSLAIPFLDAPRPVVHDAGMIGEVFAGPLTKASPGSPRHLALVEVIRRACKQAAMEADRRDKLGSLEGTP